MLSGVLCQWPCLWINDLSFLKQSHYLRLTAKVMSATLSICLFVCLSVCLYVCLSVCLSVCPSVNNITEKMVERVFVKFSGYMALTRNILQRFGYAPFNPLHRRIIFLIFRGSPCLLATLRKKCVKGFSWNFHSRLHMRQGTYWNMLKMLGLTLWVQDWFFIFWIHAW